MLPLGAGALAGTPLDIDRHSLAAILGIRLVQRLTAWTLSPTVTLQPNSCSAASLCGVHLSRLAEGGDPVQQRRVRFCELSDAYATGSSLMPQKKNPDVFELARGKAGALIGLLTGLLATLKGLPSAYDKDLQEDKLPVFNAYDTLLGLLPVMAGALRTLRVNGERAQAALEPGLLATDLADYLVAKGVPFRKAHHLVGQAVRQAAEQKTSLAELPISSYQALDQAFGPDVHQVFDFAAERGAAQRLRRHCASSCQAANRNRSGAAICR